MTPLGYAAAAGHTDAVRVLLDAGADPDDLGHRPGTPLDAALAAGHAETATVLRDAGALASPAVYTRWIAESEDPWSLAVDTRDAAFARALVAAGLAPTIDHLTLAAGSSHTPALVAVLLGAGVDPNDPDPYGGFVLEAAAQAEGPESVEIVRQLLDAGARVDAIGARVDAVGERGGGALHGAVRMGRTDTARLLLDRGADPNQANGEGQTPLHVAIRSRALSLDVIRVLLAVGADPTRTTPQGLTPAESGRGLLSPQMSGYVDAEMLPVVEAAIALLGN